MPRSGRQILAVLGLVLLGPAAWWASHLATGRSAAGLRLDSEPLAPTTEVRAEVQERAREWLRREVHIRVDGGSREVRRADLGVSLDVDAAARALSSAGRSGNPFADLAALVSAGAGATDERWHVDIEGGRLREYVRELSNEIDRPPHPARFDARGRLVELSADGAELSRAAAVAALHAALRDGRRTVTLPIRVLSSGVGESALPPQVERPPEPVLVARYSTDYDARDVARSHNVQTAADYLDGAVIEPHSRLSFNAQVGARSRERGYRLAHVIMDGEMVDGLGGGVCQVASTLHAAAFLGGLDVIQHTPHSRPSAYIPMGLDATVVWPRVDLSIQNPFPFPLTVRSRAARGQMVVELYGASRPLDVSWRRETLSTQPWDDRFVEDETVAPGRRRVTQRGIRGYTVLRARTIRGPHGVDIQESRVRYPPTARIVRVAPGTLDPFSGEPIPEGVPANPFL